MATKKKSGQSRKKVPAKPMNNYFVITKEIGADHHYNNDVKGPISELELHNFISTHVSSGGKLETLTIIQGKKASASFMIEVE